jgi:hypothetical protein
MEIPKPTSRQYQGIQDVVTSDLTSTRNLIGLMVSIQYKEQFKSHVINTISVTYL